MADRKARTATLITAAEGPANQLEGFADEAHDRIEQDLLVLDGGIRTTVLLRRLAAYKGLLSCVSPDRKGLASGATWTSDRARAPGLPMRVSTQAQTCGVQRPRLHGDVRQVLEEQARTTETSTA